MKNTSKANTNEKITALTAVKNGIIRNSNGTMELTTNGIKTVISNDGKGIVPTIDGNYKLRDDLKNKTIGKHIANINKYVNNIKIAVISIGKELSEINTDKSYTELGYKSFQEFYTNYLGMKKATVYQNINCYLMCCDIFGNVKIDVEKIGDVNANKALRIGMTPDDFQKSIEYADKNNIKITAENLTEIADKAGAKYDKEKAAKDMPKKSVKILPDIKKGFERFITNNKEYIDIAAEIAVKEIGKKAFNSEFEKSINDGIDINKSDLLYSVNSFILKGNYIVVACNGKGITKTYVMIKNKPETKK